MSPSSTSTSTSPTTPTPKPISVLFVCLGNICRSTMAEGTFTHLVHSQSQSQPSPSSHQHHQPPPYKISKIDSAGTGAYHIGHNPDTRTLQTLKSHNITTYKHSARQVSLSDFARFDYIFGMDADNVDDLRALRGRAVALAASTTSSTSTSTSTASVGRQTRTTGSEHDKQALSGKTEAQLAKVLLYGTFSGNSNSSGNSGGSNSNSNKNNNKPEEIADPYYGGDAGFEKAYEQADRFGRNFLRWLDETGGGSLSPEEEKL